MKTHLSVEGKAKCGQDIPPSHLTNNPEQVSCIGCGAKPKAQAFATRRSRGPDFNRRCSVCHQPGVVPETGMCGPCTFGDSSTVGGNF